jgi:predicted O-linked N-acetylglucosamine transferase (SPINDLY family)
MSLDSFSKEDEVVLKKILNFFFLKDFFNAEKQLEILAVKHPNNFFLENIHGSIFSSQGKYADALLKFSKVTNINPNFAEGYYNLATVFLKTKKFDDAIVFFKKSLDIDKDHFNSYFNLADCYKNLGQINNAIDNYNYYIEKKPEDIEAYNNLGIIYFDLKNHQKAKIIFNKALSIDMASINANFYMGLILSKEGKELLAINFFKRTIELDKKFYLSYLKLAEQYKADFKYSEAINVLNDFIEKNPEQQNNLADSYCALGNICIEIGDIENAFKNFESSLSFYKDDSKFFKQYIFNLNYAEQNSQKKYFDLINTYRKTLSIQKYNLDKSLYKNSSKIKIGFLSSDFREHAVGYQILGVIEKLSLDSDFELYCYSLKESETEDDFLTKRFKLSFDHWLDINSMNEKLIADKIRFDKIQILFDLNGYTANNLIEVFMYNPAPIQISWAGYLSSTGIKEIEYIVADPYVVSNKFIDFFTEKPIILDNIWSVLSCFEDANVSAQTPFYKNGFITFGSFNNLPKINKNIVKTWSEILKKVELSKLKLISLPLKSEEVKNNLKELFYTQGIAPERLILDGDFSRKELLNNYNYIDIALDTFPYGGGTTSLEASWMCVPVLTRSGDSFLSRCGASINNNLGLKDWICKDDEEYISKAIKFSLDVQNLQKVKNYLLKNKNQAKLFNTELYVKNFSDTLKKIWKDYINR